jgi:hypothetical protein
MNLGRYWPGYVLGLLTVLSASVYGFGAALVTPFIGMLIVGPAYLIQQRLRRRRGTASPSGFLGREADDVFGMVARRYLASKRAHPIRWQVIDLVYGGSMVAAIWILLGATVGLVFAVGWGVLTLLGVAILVARFWHRPPG